MARLNWRQFAAEVERRKPVFWLRDDDAASPTPQLRRLLSLIEERRVPLALAVVPELARPALFETLRGGVSVLQHGCDHRNRAAPGEKKTEFPPQEPIDAALGRLARARERLVSLAGAVALPVLAPPWNRLRRELAAALPQAGIRGLSGYGIEAPVPGLTLVNTHVDIVAWRAGRRFVGEAQAIELAMRVIPEGRPVGWLLHHAVHDEAAWVFLERLFALRGPRWAGAAELFSYTRPTHG